MIELDTAIVAGVIAAVGSAVALIIKALFSRNQNRKDQQEHEENLLKIATTMNDVNKTLSETKEFIDRRIDEVGDKIDDFSVKQNSFNLALLRHNITDTYEDYKDQKKIPNIIYESTMSLYDNYKKLGGNSFVDDEVNEMKHWEKF